jgi:uncharacterized protein YaaN involved in tellurite resistance
MDTSETILVEDVDEREDTEDVEDTKDTEDTIYTEETENTILTEDIFIYQIQEVKQQIAYMYGKIQHMDKKMDRILEILCSDCKKMRDHIDFVENVYDKVKQPFNYVMDSVNNLIAPPTITNTAPLNALEN